MFLNVNVDTRELVFGVQLSSTYPLGVVVRYEDVRL